MLKFFRTPFASTGDKTAIPDSVDSNGNVSYSQGYGFDYQRQKTDPAAKDIERDKMNQLYFDITTAIAEIQAQGVPDYITSALNGGSAYSYSKNAAVRYSGAVYLSLVDANTALPSDATKWALLPTGALVRDGTFTVAASGGTADAITLALTPTQGAFAPGPTWWRATAANATTTPTVKRDTLTAKTLVKGANFPLVAGDIPGAGAWMCSLYDATLDKEVLLNPAFPIGGVSPYQYQSLTASVASNALTVSYGGGPLDFRSGTQSNGAPTRAVQVSSNGITIPSGATLGTTSGRPARLVFLEAYNSGAPVLCVVNQAGGVQLDETNLISPTTISSGATSAGVIYSASSVSANSPYRIVGAFDITESTAGTWATVPNNAINAGSIALNSTAGFGYSQTWQDVGGGRSSGTTYYNTTGKPISVFVVGISACTTYVNSSNIQPPSSGQNTVIFTVPPGSNYSVSATSGMVSWWELR